MFRRALLLTLVPCALHAQTGRPSLRVTYLANEGVVLETASGRVLIDALFGEGLDSYHRVEQPVRDSLESAMGEFGGRAALLATHGHRDHFDEAAVARYLTANADAIGVLPADVYRRVAALLPENPRLRSAAVDSGGVRAHALGWATVSALGMPHGTTTRPIDHAAWLVELDGWTALHIGDTQMAPSAWHTFRLPEAGIDVALLPFWYLLDEEYARQMLAAVKPRAVVVLHGPLPAAEGDGLRARGGWASWTRDLRARMPMAWIPAAPGEHRVFGPGPGRDGDGAAQPRS